ncbi:MAG: hypothetical protein N4A33_09640 [Bacteriovoracaceae bacterium]|nr:hypothetical protein [Bacteriovoracaceae bacterium]
MNKEILPKDIADSLEKLKILVQEKLNLIKSSKDINITYKLDKTIVTDVDVYISKIFKEEFLGKYPFLNFYSEEDQESFKYPMIIIDPIDGTKEFSQLKDECSISFGIYYSPNLDDIRNFSWIYNPFNNFEISSIKIVKESSHQYLDKGLVSNTEFEMGLFKKDVNIVPIGSIAYKLGLLAAGHCLFVETRRAKNIWDIMAGSHISYLRGKKLLQNGIELTKLDKMFFEPAMRWE